MRPLLCGNKQSKEADDTAAMGLEELVVAAVLWLVGVLRHVYVLLRYRRDASGGGTAPERPPRVLGVVLPAGNREAEEAAAAVLPWCARAGVGRVLLHGAPDLALDGLRAALRREPGCGHAGLRRDAGTGLAVCCFRGAGEAGCACDEAAAPVGSPVPPLPGAWVDRPDADAPEAVVVFGDTLCTAGFPPWLVDACEIYHLGPLARASERRFSAALERFAATCLRGGR